MGKCVTLHDFQVLQLYHKIWPTKVTWYMLRVRNMHSWLSSDPSGLWGKAKLSYIYDDISQDKAEPLKLSPKGSCNFMTLKPFFSCIFWIVFCKKLIQNFKTSETLLWFRNISKTMLKEFRIRVARRDLDQQGSLTLTLKFKFFSSQGKNFHYFSNSSQGLKSWKNQGYFKGNPWNPLNFKARFIKE